MGFETKNFEALTRINNVLTYFKNKPINDIAGEAHFGNKCPMQKYLTKMLNSKYIVSVGIDKTSILDTKTNINKHLENPQWMKIFINRVDQSYGVGNIHTYWDCLQILNHIKRNITQ